MLELRAVLVAFVWYWFYVSFSIPVGILMAGTFDITKWSESLRYMTILYLFVVHIGSLTNYFIVVNASRKMYAENSSVTR